MSLLVLGLGGSFAPLSNNEKIAFAVQVSESLSMVQREKELRTKMESLGREKQDRLKRLKVLKDQDQVLCDTLCCTPYYIPSNSVPSRDQLKELESHIKNLEKEKVGFTFLNSTSKLLHPIFWIPNFNLTLSSHQILSF